MTQAPTKAFQGPRKGPIGTKGVALSDQASAILRDHLISELEGLGLKDDLDAWTLRAWPKANILTPADGDKVRLAFDARLARLRTPQDEEVSPAEPAPAPSANDAPRSLRTGISRLPPGLSIRQRGYRGCVANRAYKRWRYQPPKRLCIQLFVHRDLSCHLSPRALTNSRRCDARDDPFGVSTTFTKNRATQDHPGQVRRW